MKRFITGVIFIIIFLGLYNYFVDEKENMTTSHVVAKDKLIKEQKTKLLDVHKKSVVKAKNMDKGEKKEDDEVVMNSEVLKGLYTNLKMRNWDDFDEIYYSQIKLLRDGQDHALFYQEFKDFFKNNKLSIVMQRGILAFLVDASTKESIALIFEMFDEDIIFDKEVENKFITYFVDSTSISKDDPSIDFKGVIKALKHGYKTTENSRLRRVAAVLLTDYETVEMDVMLFRDYMQADAPDKKRAAYAGLMNLHSRTMLPNLRSYLSSEDEQVKTTAGMVLSNMATDEAVEVFADWILVDATMEDLSHIKKWLGNMMKMVGVSKFSKTINFGKIEPEEFRVELEEFFDKEQEKKNASVSSN